MNITVKGKEHRVEREKLLLQELLNINNVENPEMVSIQLNGEFVNNAYGEVVLNSGDIVDYLDFMGGGAL